MNISSRFIKSVGVVLVMVAVSALLAPPVTATEARAPQESHQADASPSRLLGLWQVWIHLWNGLIAEVTGSPLLQEVVDEVLPGWDGAPDAAACETGCNEKGGAIDPDG